MSHHHTTLAGLITGLILGVTTPASATSFASYGEGAGEFVEAHGIAVERLHGNLYVLDSGNRRIEKYTKSGRFLFAWGWGVGDGRTHALQRCFHRCFAGLSGDGAGQLSFAQGVAIENDPHSGSFGDVYVVDIGNHRVEAYSATGAFLSMLGGQVNKTAQQYHEGANENRCPVHPRDRCGAGTVGSGPGEFEFGVEGNFIAVGSGGLVYVGDRNRIEEFGSDGRYRKEITFQAPAGDSKDRELGGISGVTLDSSSDMYVIRNGVSGIHQYDPSGKLVRVFDDKGWPARPEEPAPAIESDSSGGLFIDAFEYGKHSMVTYDATGRQVGKFDSGTEDGLHGLAYNPATKQLYIINTNNNTTPRVADIRILIPPPPEKLPVSGLLNWLTEW